MKPLYFGFILLLQLIIGAGCTNAPVGSTRETGEPVIPWTYANLRVLDGDDADDPKLDLLAAYTRQQDSNLQIRLDFLELDELPNFDLYIPIDLQPGGNDSLPVNYLPDFAWDILLRISANQGIQVFHYDPSSQQTIEGVAGSGVHVVRNPALDTLTISFQPGSLRAGDLGETVDLFEPFNQYRFQVLLTGTDEPAVVDQIGPVHSDSLPPDPAPVLFVFWNSYPAYTPALALRRWDGAHTGPQGGRHGLYNLLRTARNAGIPLVLLDLNNPQALSTLDYADHIAHITGMAERQQVILPYTLPASNLLKIAVQTGAMDVFQSETQMAAEEFGLPEAQSIFSPFGLSSLKSWIQSGADVKQRLVFTPSSINRDNQPGQSKPRIPITSAVYGWGPYRVIPVPGYSDNSFLPEQASRSGPAVEVNRALIRTAVSANEPGSTNPILVLGGNLPGSTWGIPQSARASFEYIASRPWISVLNYNHLLTHSLSSGPVPALTGQNNQADSRQMAQLYAALQAAPLNKLTAAAWQYWMTLYAPIYPAWENITEMRSFYLDEIGSILSAARWADNPQPFSNCSVDTDLDGDFECVLASKNIYLICDPNDSSLTYGFYLEADGTAHQFIGPSTQSITGLSDPSTWQDGDDFSTDPTIITGGFLEYQSPDQVLNEEQALTFLWSGGDIALKTYRITPVGLSVEYQMRTGAAAQKKQIPLLLDPWDRFSRAWANTYQTEQGAESVTWGIEGSLQVSIISSPNPNLTSFLESVEYMALPENPNLDFPAGHYLPFPLALIDVQIVDGIPIQIEVMP